MKKRLLSLKKCTKCILPETYPFINFDKDEYVIICNNYETQKFLGENKLHEVFRKI